MAPYGRIPVFTAPSSARAGEDVLVSASVKNAGNVGGYFWLKYYDDDTGLVVGSYPQQWILNGVTTNFPEKTLTMPDSDFKISAKVFCENDTLLQDTRTQVVSLVTGSGDGVCDGDTSWRPAGYTWAHCMGGEEECVSVEFVQSSLSGDKAVLMVNRSWEYLDVSEILRSGESQTYEGKKAKWTVKVNGVAGSGAAGSAIVDICYELPIDCPPPTVSIPTVSNYNPASGDQVDFTSYASGGVGHSIVSRHWDFGDGTSSTEENPSKTWTNTTGADVEYTVTFTATNECGTSNSTTTVITVSSAPVKHGIEIQFPSSMNGKELIAHGAISTILGLWWTGPHVVDGVIWNKGRCTWENIDSSKTYAIQSGDACECGLVREEPTECAGIFSNNDAVIILIRNPGFDFRVYSANDIFPLTDSSFSVLYLDETSGDIVDKTFTEWICGLIGLESGYECDMFWAEFYDPIFVANYMSIQKTGKDIMGTPRELGWLDHVAFVASLVGSLPAFNLFPFAGITKNLGTGIKVIIDKTLSITDLLSAELQECGRAMADICVHAPKVIRDLIPDELTRLREAMVKVFGEVEGNRYVDEALAVTSKLFDEAFSIISKDTVTIQELAKFDTLLTDNPELGGELGDHYYRALIGRFPFPAAPTAEDLNAIRHHARSIHTKDVIRSWHTSPLSDRDLMGSHSRIYQLMNRDYARLEKAFGDKRAVVWVRSQGNIADSVAHAGGEADRVARSMTDFVWNSETVAKATKRTEEAIAEDYLFVADKLESTEVGAWRGEATEFVNDLMDDGVVMVDDITTLLEPWTPTPPVLPATVKPIALGAKWFSDFGALDAFAAMVDDAAKATINLAGDDLAKAGDALVDVCEEAPDVIKAMDAAEELNIRSALIKIYGDVDGNKYVDDALQAASAFVRKYYDILEDFRTGAAGLPDDAVATILSKGQEVPKDITDLIIEFESAGTIDNLCDELMQAAPEYPLGSAFKTLSTEKHIIDEAIMPGFTNKHCKVAELATAAAEPIPTMQISEGTNEIAHKAADLGFTVKPIADDIVEATEKFSEETLTSKWKLIARDLAGARFAKVAKALKKMSRREKFMTAWWFWELMSFVIGYMLLKAFGIFPGDRSMKAFQRIKAMESAFFTCKTACESEFWEALEEAVPVYETVIREAEAYLADNLSALDREHSLLTLKSSIDCAHISLEMWQSCLANKGMNLDGIHGEVIFSSNIKCMAYVDGQAIGTVWESGLKVDVLIGERTLEMKLEDYEGCTETVTITEEPQHLFNCEFVEKTCADPVPTITGPAAGIVKQAVQFTGAATTESEITWWSWDFGDGDDSHDQSPSHMYWSAGTYTVKLTVTDDCGTATAEHEIIITAESGIPIPTPTEKSATVYVSMPTNTKTGRVLVWQDNPEVYIDGQYERKAPGSISFGGWNQPEVKSCVLMVRATGYQDLSKTFDLKDKDSLTWDPTMSPVGYTPQPGTHKIDFYIPEGATLGIPAKITLLKKLTTGMRRIRDNE